MADMLWMYNGEQDMPPVEPKFKGFLHEATVGKDNSVHWAAGSSRGCVSFALLPD